MIDLRSDTVTKPTPEMKQAMIKAELGDDAMGEDPTVKELEKRVAQLLGKEAAMFTCTATMANQIAVRVHCEAGDELLINSTGHIAIYEAGAPAAISGVTVRKIDGAKGMLSVGDLKGLPWPDDPHFPRTRLVCLENTTNLGGGCVYPMKGFREVSDWARSNDLKLHLDGSRLFNATIAGGYTPGEMGACVDTVSLCFSKGLGCPMGAIIAGNAKDMHKARRFRKMLGGSCRQVGMIAGAAIYALDFHVDRLVEDHQKARLLAEGLSRIEGIKLLNDSMPETNRVFFDLDPAHGSAGELVGALISHGVKIGAVGQSRMRAVTHLDVDFDDIPLAVKAVEAILSGGCILGK